VKQTIFYYSKLEMQLAFTLKYDYQNLNAFTLPVLTEMGYYVIVIIMESINVFICLCNGQLYIETISSGATTLIPCRTLFCGDRKLKLNPEVSSWNRGHWGYYIKFIYWVIQFSTTFSFPCELLFQKRCTESYHFSLL